MRKILDTSGMAQAGPEYLNETITYLESEHECFWPFIQIRNSHKILNPHILYVELYFKRQQTDTV